MYPVIWLPLINSTKNIGFPDMYGNDSISIPNVTFKEGIYGNNATELGHITIKNTLRDDIVKNGFTISTFIQMSNNMSVMKYGITNGGFSIGINSAGIMTVYNGSDETSSLVSMDCRDSIGKWASLTILYDGHSSITVYINGNYISGCDNATNGDGDTIDMYIGGPVFNTKIYVNTISIEQLYEDYLCMVVGYKFDGSGLSDDSCTEYDYSGFLHDVTYTSKALLTSTCSPVRPYTTIIPSNITLCPDKSTWSDFFINFWVYPVTTDDASQIIFNYGSDTTARIIVSVDYNSEANPTTRLHVSYYSAASGNAQNYYKTITFSEWHMVSLRLEALDFKAFIDCEQILDIPNGDIFADGNFILNAFNGAYSDFRFYMRTPNDNYIKWLYNGVTIMDNKGTIHSGNLTEDDTVSFSFNNDNGFTCPNIIVSSSADDAMKYDSINQTLTIRDFNEF